MKKYSLKENGAKFTLRKYVFAYVLYDCVAPKYTFNSDFLNVGQKSQSFVVSSVI